MLCSCLTRSRSNRTHQGVLDVAAVVVEALRRYFPLQVRGGRWWHLPQAAPDPPRLRHGSC